MNTPQFHNYVIHTWTHAPLVENHTSPLSCLVRIYQWLPTDFGMASESVEPWLESRHTQDFSRASAFQPRVSLVSISPQQGWAALLTRGFLMKPLPGLRLTLSSPNLHFQLFPGTLQCHPLPDGCLKRNWLIGVYRRHSFKIPIFIKRITNNI